MNTALQKMQYEKSPGKNGIPTEAYKNLKWGPQTVLMKIIVLFWQNDQFNPVDWQQKLSILPKKGDLADPNKWRGIALGDIAAKCISSIIANRLTKHLSDFRINEQCGSLFWKRMRRCHLHLENGPSNPLRAQPQSSCTLVHYAEKQLKVLYDK